MGHPEHDLLFVATPVARAAGLKNPADAINQARKNHKAGRDLAGLIRQERISLPKDIRGHALRSTTVLFTESETYEMLLRGKAPQSEPFRKWVTEEVLPTIRKTGQYNAAESSDPIAVGIMDAGVAKTLTMAARSQRPYEDHYHDPAHSTRTTSPPRRSRHRHHPSY
ncbi:Bro-N domain-containing protein [Pseudomonas sp. VE 196-7]|uniref:BRO-N domain-containing protein n=1 Tax=Pseudomonas sp. VE 196-7 TaxID=2956726 RepID=UPI00397EAE25